MSAVLAPVAPQPPQAAVPAPPDTGVRPRRWTRGEYYRAAEAGLFRPDERLELLDGEIVEKMTENAPHSSAVRRARRQLTRAFDGVLCFVSEQHPITLPDESEPEPDLALVIGIEEEFDGRHPAAADILLVLEVSNTTLAFDTGPKARAYAAAGIRDYWVLNLNERRLEVHRNPQNGAYQSITPLDENEAVSPLAAPQAFVRVADLLPSPVA